MPQNQIVSRLDPSAPCWRPRAPSPSREGEILWLKHRHLVSDEHFNESGLDDGAMFHLVLVIRSCESDTNHLDVCTLTSFRGQLVQEKFVGQPERWRRYLPIAPQPLYPHCNYLTLVDKELRKSSYVKIDAVWTVHCDMLEPYDRSKPDDKYPITDYSLTIAKSLLKFYGAYANHSPRATSFSPANHICLHEGN